MASAECPDCWQVLPPGHVCRCECGQPLATHSPLPRPKPMTSWKSARSVDAPLPPAPPVTIVVRPVQRARGAMVGTLSDEARERMRAGQQARRARERAARATHPSPAGLQTPIQASGKASG